MGCRRKVTTRSKRRAARKKRHISRLLASCSLTYAISRRGIASGLTRGLAFALYSSRSFFESAKEVHQVAASVSSRLRLECTPPLGCRRLFFLFSGGSIDSIKRASIKRTMVSTDVWTSALSTMVPSSLTGKMPNQENRFHLPLSRSVV